MLSLYQQLATCDGASWFHTDLHVHTPASYDFKWDGLDRADFNEYKYVESMLNVGLQVVAITDHSSVQWVDMMKKAARKLRERKLGRLVVLPGVEISVGGIHLCLVFPEDRNQEDLEDVLSLLLIPPVKRGKADTTCPLGVEEVVKITHEKNGLVVGAHCLSSKAGALNAIEGQVRERALAVIDVLEVKPQHDPRIALETAAKYGWRGRPVVISTDAHCPGELKGQLTRFKAASASFVGLSQVAFEPEHRVGFGAPPDNMHPRLLGFQTDSGIYEGELFRFSPNLNVLIGGRGAGKSAALDLLRFAFDMPPRREENLPDFANRIRGFLGDSGAVRAFVTDASGKTLCIERSAKCTVNKAKNSREPVTFTEPPRVHELIADKFIEVEASPLERFPVEFYGQGEVLELTRKADDQLKLIDEHVDFGDLLEQEEGFISQLKESAGIISKLENDKLTLVQQVSEKSLLETRIAYLRAQLSDPVFQTRELWKAEAAYLRSIGNDLAAMSKTVAKALVVQPSTREQLPSETPNLELMTVAADLATEMTNKVDGARKELEAASTNVVQRFNDHKSKWETLDKEAEERFQAKLKEMGGLDLESLHDELVEKQEVLDKITRIFEPELAACEKKLAEAWKEHRLLAANLAACREDIHGARKAQVGCLVAKMKGAVRVEVVRAGNRSGYFAHLRTMYEGSRIVQADTQLGLVCDSLSPVELFQCIVDKNEKRLAEIPGVTPSTVQKALGHPSLEMVLELPSVATPDEPVISLRREGDTNWTPLDKLSFGERCSAILSIALLDKNKPLVVDQPEDELDHSFITQDIVEGMRTIKSGRQIIVATHNPNIPVLGDAELVMRLAKQPARQACRILAQGALEKEDVLPHVLALEGGKDAFERRRQRYRL